MRELRVHGRPPRHACALLACAWLLGCAPTPPDAPPEPMELQGRWLGMAVVGVESPSAQMLGVPPVVKGVVVTEVAQGADSRAASAGIQAGDVIAAVEGQPVTNLAELYTLSTRQSTQRPLTIDLVRNGQAMRATLAAPPGMANPMMPTAAATGTPQFFCPAEGLRWSHADVQPSFRCPRCGGPVTSVAP